MSIWCGVADLDVRGIPNDTADANYSGIGNPSVNFDVAYTFGYHGLLRFTVDFRDAEHNYFDADGEALLTPADARALAAALTEAADLIDKVDGGRTGMVAQ